MDKRLSQAIGALVLCASGVSAQTATVVVSHDDPDGIVAPGETIRLRVWHTRSVESILAGIAGDLEATGDLGSSGNTSSELALSFTSQLYPNTPGTPSGGSIRGVSYEFVSHPLFTFNLVEAYSRWGGVEALSFDWTAPAVSQPTTVEFNWIPSAAYPNVRAILPSYSQLNWAFLPTTYTGASLTVLPSPPAGALVIPLALLGARRRARPARW